MADNTLVLNAGSSSIKFSLFAVDGDRTQLARKISGELEGLGPGEERFRAFDQSGNLLVDEVFKSAAGDELDHEEALNLLFEWLSNHPGSAQLLAAGHRVVHGGNLFFAPARIDQQVLAQLEELIPLAPLHQPHNLAAIYALGKLLPKMPQVACFDTAFHHTQPEVAQLFALPREITDWGIQRYGFHGLSYEFIAQAMPQVLEDAAGDRVVVAHLGNGASMCALKAGSSVATTMGFTALDGLMMGTRCGNIDPGVLLYLQSERGMDVNQVSDLLYHKSGLLGVSGISNDMRELLATEDPRARDAIELFVYRINRELGSLVAALGGLDALVFTGGIGEHAAAIRAQVCQAAEWVGIRLDEDANRAHGPCITHQKSPVSAWVIPTDEELMIAQHTLATLQHTEVVTC